VSSIPLYRVVKHGIELRIRLTPKSSRDQIGTAIETGDGAAIQVFVRAIPADGAANAALIALVAKKLSIPRSSVRLKSGGKSRTKVLALHGDAAGLKASIDEHLTRQA